MKEFSKNVPNSLKYPAEYIAYFLGHPVDVVFRPTKLCVKFEWSTVNDSRNKNGV